MKIIITLIILLNYSIFAYSQKFLKNGFLPQKTFLLGFESGGSLTKIESEYSRTGKDYIFYSLRIVPKIAYSPYKNILTGAYYMREIAVYPDMPVQINYGFGGFVRFYLPFINNLLKLNNKFLSSRFLFFSEIYIEKNNFIFDDDKKNIITSENLNTFFYGIKIGSNFRLFNKLYIELAYVFNFDNRNNDFKVFHPELGLEYIFNISKK